MTNIGKTNFSLAHQVKVGAQSVGKAFKRLVKKEKSPLQAHQKMVRDANKKYEVYPTDNKQRKTSANAHGTSTLQKPKQAEKPGVVEKFERDVEANKKPIEKSVTREEIKEDIKGVKFEELTAKFGGTNAPKKNLPTVPVGAHKARNLQGLSTAEKRIKLAQEAGGGRGPQAGMLGGLNDAIAERNKSE